ncbi:MAG: sigma-54 dependent transcriptional regulator [Deltaproteobacteria bacterium]|nr:sigma-54 dependent transcriptional regulator [Deltaproteobacteria bacterium]
MTQILIADDEASIRTILSKAMEKKGFEVHRARTGSEALEFLKTYPIDVAIVDIRMPGLTGLELLDHQPEFPSRPSIFVITAQDTMENAVAAMKKGAFDYLTKPFDLDELSILVDRALETRNLKNEYARLKETGAGSGKPMLIGHSKSIREIFKTIGRVANQDVTVLIQGESGTGKELAARAIHFQGSRADYPFVAVNCAAIPANLLESELFGHKKGAFTGATADKMGLFERAQMGTLLLDEIGEMPQALQSKLLRVIQEKEVQRVGDTKTVPVNVRLIAATNKSLAGLVKRGQFREDLFFRLNVVPLELPPLRERKSDIPPLVDYFMEKNTRDLGGEPCRITSDALEFLENRKWPGNVRELENFLKRAFVLAKGGILDLAALVALAPEEGEAAPPSGHGSLEEVIDFHLQNLFSRFDDGEKNLYDRLLPAMERPLIRRALEKSRDNQLKAADMLGINRNTLRKKIRELKIDRRRKSNPP